MMPRVEWTQESSADCKRSGAASDEESPHFDSDFSEKLDRLAEIFPHVSRTDLSRRIEDHAEKSLEQLVDALVIEDKTDEKTDEAARRDNQKQTRRKLLDPEIQTLKEILPNHSMPEIQHQYELHNGDFDLIVRSLLEKERLTITQKDTQFLAQELSSLTGRPVPLATKYLLKNEGHFVKSLIDVVSCETKIVRESSSRVQRRQAESTYDPQKTEFQELESLYASNRELQAIYKPFLIKLVILLKGDFSKFADICASIQESNLQQMTFAVEEKQLETKSQSEGQSAPIFAVKKFNQPSVKLRLPEAAKKLQRLQAQNQDRRPGNGSSARYVSQEPPKPPASVAPYHKSSQEVLAKFTAGGGVKLDLHGLAVDSAVSLAGETVDHWWQQELQHREHAGRLDKYGVKAQFMQHLAIVTGRGLHSKDGVPHIRIQVQKYLRRSGYQYNEESWGYTIYGKTSK